MCSHGTDRRNIRENSRRLFSPALLCFYDYSFDVQAQEPVSKCYSAVERRKSSLLESSPLSSYRTTPLYAVLPFSILQRRSCRHTSKPSCSRSCGDCIFSVTFHLPMRSSVAAPVQYFPARGDATCTVLLKGGIRVHLPTTPSSPFDRVFFDLHARSHRP